MLALSPQAGELLLQATQSRELEEALHKVLREYLDLKLASLTAAMSLREEKQPCGFAEFREKTQEDFRYDVERDLWQQERLETLQAHDEALRERWH